MTVNVKWRVISEYQIDTMSYVELDLPLLDLVIDDQNIYITYDQFIEWAEEFHKALQCVIDRKRSIAVDE